MVAYHHIRLAALEVPYGKAAVLFGKSEERLHHVIHPRRFNKGIEWMSRTKSIPQGESTVICPALSLMHFLVGAVIGTIYIAIDSGSNHRMVQSRVELDFLIAVIAFYFYP